MSEGDGETAAAGMQTEGRYECATCGDPLNIVGIVGHDCDAVLRAEDLTHDDASALMYIEERVVNNQASLDPEQMNWDDHQAIKLFRAAGVLEVSEMRGPPERVRMDVEYFSDRAWELAKRCRKRRARSSLTDADAVLDTEP
jgi:hypothetical protein